MARKLPKRLQHQVNRFRARISKVKGNFGELGFKTVMQTRGYNVKETGRGSDFKIGKKEYDIKMDGSRPTKFQKKRKKKLGKNLIFVHYGYGGRR